MAMSTSNETRAFRMKTSMVRAPILVTGAHRSGTTLIGSIVAEAGPHFIYEPFNPCSPPGMALPQIQSLYHYLDGNKWPDLQKSLVQLCSGYFYPFSRPGSPFKDRLSLMQKSANVKLAYLRGKRLLLKSSELMLSISTFVKATSGKVIVAVRHPCAFAQSCERMGWRYDLSALTSQSDFYERFLSRVPEFGRCRDDRIPATVVDNTWLWFALHSYLVNLMDQDVAANLMVVTHENLCLNPQFEFARIAEFLGLEMSPAIEALIAHKTEGRVVDVVGDQQHVLERNSMQLASSWRKRMPEHIQSWVNSVARPVSGLFFDSSG